MHHFGSFCLDIETGEPRLLVEWSGEMLIYLPSINTGSYWSELINQYHNSQSKTDQATTETRKKSCKYSWLRSFNNSLT